jgi:hypothetical protein
MRNRLVAFGILIELLLISLLLAAQAHAEDSITISNVEKTYCGRIGVYEMTVNNSLDVDLQAVIVVLTHASFGGLDYDFKLIKEIFRAGSQKTVSFTSALPKRVYATIITLNAVADMQWRWYDFEP